MERGDGVARMVGQDQRRDHRRHRRIVGDRAGALAARLDPETAQRVERGGRLIVGLDQHRDRGFRHRCREIAKTPGRPLDVVAVAWRLHQLDVAR